LPEQALLATENRRRCDRAIWAGLGRLPDEETDFPTIVVEFVSGRRRDYLRDYEEKLREYVAAGVIEYWIIDRFRRMMTGHRTGPEGVTTQVIPESGSYQTDLLPGFVLPLARLLAKADQWSPKKRRPRPPAQGSD
ncbi:MAG TPA: Uma2 family endonuclease, partial [Isosphaeraceae bacterium]